MAVFSANFPSVNSVYRLDLTVVETSYNAAANTSLITYQLDIVYVSGQRYVGDYDRPCWVKINGVTVKSGMYAWNFSSGYTLTISGGTTTVAHNPDGSLVMACQGYADFNNAPYPPATGPSYTNNGTATATGNLTLTDLDRDLCWVYYAGAWRRSKGIWVYYSGAWRRAKNIWTYSGGAWRLGK